jgi:hypothetical protein
MKCGLHQATLTQVLLAFAREQSFSEKVFRSF